MFDCSNSPRYIYEGAIVGGGERMLGCRVLRRRCIVHVSSKLASTANNLLIAAAKAEVVDWQTTTTTCLKANVSMLVVHVQVCCVKAQPQSRRRRRTHVASRPRTLKTDVWLPVSDAQRTEHKSLCNLAFLLWVNTTSTVDNCSKR